MKKLVSFGIRMTSPILTPMDAPDVEFEITYTVPLEVDLFSEIEKQARQRGVKVETLVNLWLRQKLAEQTAV